MQAPLAAPPRPLPDTDPIASALAMPPAAATAIEDVDGLVAGAQEARRAAPGALRSFGGRRVRHRPAAWAFATGYQAALRRWCPDSRTTSSRPSASPRPAATALGTSRPRSRDAGAGRCRSPAPSAGPRSDRRARCCSWSARWPRRRTHPPRVPRSGWPRFPRMRRARDRADAADRLRAGGPARPIALHDVRVAADSLLPGDGYDRYVKPFRTIEDTHINAALMAWLLREARVRGWPASLCGTPGRGACGAPAREHDGSASATCRVVSPGALAWRRGQLLRRETRIALGGRRPKRSRGRPAGCGIRRSSASPPARGCSVPPRAWERLAAPAAGVSAPRAA